MCFFQKKRNLFLFIIAFELITNVGDDEWAQCSTNRPNDDVCRDEAATAAASSDDDDVDGCWPRVPGRVVALWVVCLAPETVQNASIK